MIKIAVIIFLILTFAGPFWIICTSKIDFNADYRTANRESIHIAPLPEEHPEAIIQVYGARAFSWRGIFALHTWLAIKEKNAKQYTVYQIVGWRFFRGLPGISIEKDIPDRRWFNQDPFIIFDMRGKEAERIIPKILNSITHYPYINYYSTWPGPNSNTFISYIARDVAEMKLAIPSNAIGKDFTGKRFFQSAPSGTGYQLSLYGCAGVTIAAKEGLEINFLGLVYGINPTAIKLPGFGDIAFRKH